MHGEKTNRQQGWEWDLLHALGAGFGVDERLENRENVPAVIDHAGEDVAQRGIALGFPMPLQEHRGRNFDVAAQLFSGMPPKEQPVEEGRLPLREVEIVLGVFGGVRRGLRGRVGFSLHQRHRTEWAVYRNFSRRQEARSKERLFLITFKHITTRANEAAPLTPKGAAKQILSTPK